MNPIENETYSIKDITEIFVSMTTLLFDQLPIPINFIDAEGKVIIMNQAFLDYIDADLESIKGKHLSEVDPSVRLPIVVKTGKAELSQKHRFHNGRESLVHRIPLFYKDKVIGGVGIILIEDLNYVLDTFAENRMLQSIKINKAQRVSDIYKSKYTFSDIITCSDVGQNTKEKAKVYADNDFPVLITGESGVGKELFAHAIHNSSKRSDQPFVRVNCAAIPDSLIESELFGYDKGAFTGAQNKGRVGKFELANGGTIFLDEIGDFPLELQAKLLRVLQEREIEKIGSNEIVKLDIRVIAATNDNLDLRIKENKFRQDLYYRLNVLNLPVPSLKERREDIPLLIEHFYTLLYQNFGIYKKIPQKIIEILMEFNWPGNIRELKNIVERMAVNSTGESIAIEDVPNYILEFKKSKTEVYEVAPNYSTSNLKAILQETERDIIHKTLSNCSGNKAKAAKLLGIPRMTLYRKLEQYNSQ